jgi:muramoyltetrapeptide carboxypeptidase LdcA involved in peptidoglycan recycling
MKVALVNFAEYEKFNSTVSFKQDLEFLVENKIDYVDYCFNYDKKLDLLAGFRKALANPEIDLIWFVCGGNKTIKFLDDIDWEVVKKANKIYAGASDFTHFSFKAVQNGQVCYYGTSLQEIKKYHPSPKSRKYLADFLQTGKIEKYNHTNLYKTVSNLDEEKIVGGHTFLTTFMLNEVKIDLRDRFLFLEHHYIPGESLEDLEYFVDQIKMVTKGNLPKGFIFGHSMLFGKKGKIMNVATINKKMVEWLREYDLPIAYIDHFKQIVKFS